MIWGYPHFRKPPNEASQTWIIVVVVSDLEATGPRLSVTITVLYFFRTPNPVEHIGDSSCCAQKSNDKLFATKQRLHSLAEPTSSFEMSTKDDIADEQENTIYNPK